MKAAVIYPAGAMDKSGKPKYSEVPEPVAQNEREILVSVLAAAISNIDKRKAAGQHYSSVDVPKGPLTPGGDGIVLLSDGTKVYARGITGMMAEKALIDKYQTIRLPAGIDNVIAAALPNAVAGSAMAMKFRAGMKPGETILINGATSFTGKLAVQIAKHYGAKKIIVTGRNPATLKQLLTLGADEIIPLQENDQSLIGRLKELQKNSPVDIIVDYLWGHTAQLILGVFKGNGSFTNGLRFVSVGSVTGDKIELSAAVLRSADIRLSGSGLGSWTKDEMKQLFTTVVPEMFDLAVSGKLTVDTETADLAAIESVWDRPVADGKRLVVNM